MQIAKRNKKEELKSKSELLRQVRWTKLYDAIERKLEISREREETFTVYDSDTQRTATTIESTVIDDSEDDTNSDDPDLEIGDRVRLMRHPYGKGTIRCITEKTVMLYSDILKKEIRKYKTTIEKL